MIKNGKTQELRILSPNHTSEHGATIALKLNDAFFIPIHDLFGNISLLLSDQNEPQAYRYTAFGKKATGTQNANPWRYASKRFDPETSLSYFGRRYYDPATAHWTSPDPAEFIDGPNYHAYLRNNPLYRLDAHGLFGESLWENGYTYASEGLYGLYNMGEDFCNIAGTMGEWLHADMEYEYGNDPYAFHSKMQSSWNEWGQFSDHISESPGTHIGNAIAPMCMQAYNLDENASFGERFLSYSGATLEIGLFASGAYKGISALRNLTKTSKLSTVTKGVNVSRGAENANARIYLHRKLIAQEIAGGHAFEKHIINRGEFRGFIRTRTQFSEHIENVLNNPTKAKQLRNNRTGYWHQETGTVVVRNPMAIDGGTAFQPNKGITYYQERLR